MKNHFGLGNVLVIVITIILFIAALFLKGFYKRFIDRSRGFIGFNQNNIVEL